MEKHILEKYIDLILDVGINLEKGQKVIISGEPVHWDFIGALAEKAYAKGASYVRVLADHPKLMRARVNYSAEEFLDHVPSYASHEIETYVKEGWSLVRIDGQETPDFFADVDSKKLSKIYSANSRQTEPFKKAMLGGPCAWTIVPMATELWAKKVFPGSANPKQDLEKTLIKILRLDQENPSESWREHGKKLNKFSDAMTSLNLEYLHFQAPGTDLKVYLIPESRFFAGFKKTSGGKSVLVNIPTEEVFTTPDYRRTEGRAEITRPVNVLGKNVEGAWFEFREGKVVDYGARKHKDALDGFFAVDEGAKFLGEIALVDSTSPIFQTGLLFDSILIDENAACHMALGSGFSFVVPGGSQKTSDELKTMGVNQSLVHIDFMISDEKMNISGHGRDGKKHELMKNGKFV